MFAPVVLAADYAATLDLAATTEVRGRYTLVDSVQAAGFDFYEQPQLRARGTNRRWEYTLSYLPSLTLPDFESGVSCDSSASNTCALLHSGGAGLAWHDRAVRLALNEDATYGRFNSAYLLTPATSGQSPAGGMVQPALQLITKPITITLLTTRTAASAQVRTDRRTRLSVDAAYTLSGGLDTDSQNVLPQEKGPSGDASLSFTLSRRDQLLTIAQAQLSDFTHHTCLVPTGPASTIPVPCEPQDRLVQVSQGIVHAIERSTSLGMSVGITLAWTRLTHEDPYVDARFPNASLSLNHLFGERGTSSLQVGVELAPAVDQLTGVVNQRVQGQASVVDRVDEVTTLRAGTSALHAFPTSQSFAATMVSGEVELDYLVNKRLRLAFGERGAWQTQEPLGTFFSTVTYFDVTVFAPTLRY